jgi:hypothetical protein
MESKRGNESGQKNDGRFAVNRIGKNLKTYRPPMLRARGLLCLVLRRGRNPDPKSLLRKALSGLIWYR